ncbi:heavy-metal-associated domain-containing protein, partial [Rhodovulum sulfidophilum]
MTAMTTTRLKLEGLHCAGCVRRVERALTELPDVGAARVNLATGSAEIEHSGPVAPLIGAIKGVGFGVGQTEIALAVGGASCASCTGRIERTLMAQPGVLSASMNLASGQARVTLAEGLDDAAALARAVTEAGYPATPLRAE